MSQSSSISAIQKLDKVNKIKQRQIYCTVNLETVMVSPLTVGDDLNLRTMLSSPDVYDQKLAETIYQHIEFIDRDKRPNFNDFLYEFSDFDRQSIHWGVFAATYNSFGDQTITCNNCNHSWEDEIKADEVLQEDFAELWDKDKPFTDYTYPVEIYYDPDNEVNIEKVVFNTKVPSFKDHINILQYVDQDTLQRNFQDIGKMFSTTEEIALITDSIEVHEFKEEEEEEVEETSEEEQSSEDESGEEKQKSGKSKTKKAKTTVNNNVSTINKLLEIYKVINDYILLDTEQHIVDKYREEFDKYSPEFYKPYTCSKCGNEFNFDVNVEVNLFRKFLRF